jgi:hypothetical protein
MSFFEYGNKASRYQWRAFVNMVIKLLEISNEIL